MTFDRQNRRLEEAARAAASVGERQRDPRLPDDGTPRRIMGTWTTLGVVALMVGGVGFAVWLLGTFLFSG